MSVGVVDKSTGDRIQTAGNPLDKVGNLANLTTTAKGSAVEAINEVNAGLATKADLTDLAPAFSTATAYTVGQYVSYEGNIYKCTSAHSAGAWAAGDFTLVAVGSELSAINSNLITLNANRIIRQGIANQSSAITITFAGKGHTRIANMVLMLATQAKVYPPIPIMFTGVDGPNMDITSVVVADNELGITTSGLSITIPSNLCGWGTHLLYKLFPDDNITVSVS